MTNRTFSLTVSRRNNAFLRLFSVKFFSVLLLLMICSGESFATVWNYDFATGTGSYATASGSKTDFFASTPANGGTYRLRCASTGNFGSGFVLANPGTTLGTGSELQINSSITASTNKFGVYDWTSPSTVAYLKTKIRTSSSGNGSLNISVGTNAIGSDNNGYTNEYNISLTSLTIAYSSGSISSVVRRNSGSNTTITSSGITKDGDQIIEIYANNGSTTVSYTKGGTNSLATKTWDLWIDGSKIVSNATTAGSLAANTNISGFAFFAESSVSNAAYIYIDDLEYSNALPAAPSTDATLSSMTISAGTLSPSFATGTTSYTASVSNDSQVKHTARIHLMPRLQNNR